MPAEDGSFWTRALGAFGVDDFYGKWIVIPGRRAAEWCASVFDPKVIDGGVHGIARLVTGSGDELRGLQSGQVRWYASGIAIAGVVLVILFLILGGAF